MVFTVFSMAFTSSVELALRSHCDFEGSVEQSMVFTVFSMVFTSSLELPFRSHCDFEGLVEQSTVFTVFSEAQSSWPFEVTAIWKAQPSKA